MNAAMLDNTASRAIVDTVPFSDSAYALVAEAPRLRSIVVPDLTAPAAQALATAVQGSGHQVAFHDATAGALGSFADQLAAGLCMPVGDVSFVDRCMELAGIRKPPWNCYPASLKLYMHHLPRHTTVSGALRWPKPMFVRPVIDRAFRGFVLREVPDEHSFAERTALETLLAMDRRERVWVAAPLSIASTWRYFVLGGELLGYHWVRGASDPEPDFDEVSAIIAALPMEVPHVLDVAVLQTGTTSLLRTRDAWGLTYPEFAPTTAPAPLEFLRLLWTRWTQIARGRPRAATGQA